MELSETSFFKGDMISFFKDVALFKTLIGDKNFEVIFCKI